VWESELALVQALALQLQLEPMLAFLISPVFQDQKDDAVPILQVSYHYEILGYEDFQNISYAKLIFVSDCFDPDLSS
jgi:hypothetical protein